MELIDNLYTYEAQNKLISLRRKKILSALYLLIKYYFINQMKNIIRISNQHSDSITQS